MTKLTFNVCFEKRENVDNTQKRFRVKNVYANVHGRSICSFHIIANCNQNS